MARPRTSSALGRETQQTAVQRTQPAVDHGVLEAQLRRLEDNENDREAKMLSEFATLCIAVSASPLTDKANSYFRPMLQFAIRHRLADDMQLAQMGDAKRESANRWVNDKAKPPLSTQRQVLRELAARARERASELRNG